jgi:spore coat protein CotH
MRTVLFLEASRRDIPALRANFVRVVINGESWGIYTNVQQFDTTFARDFYGTRKGARWKVPGSTGGRGGLAYLGDDLEPYRQIYELRSKENPRAWVSLILLCKTLSETPVERLETAFDPFILANDADRPLASSLA